MEDARQRAAGALAGLPILLKLGIALFALGSAADLLYHLLPASRAIESLLGPHGHYAHVATFGGMVLLLVAVVRRGLAGDG